MENQEYMREPMKNVINRTKGGTRGMAGMLDSAANFHYKYKSKMCDVCPLLDIESHRINYCKKFELNNLYYSELKFYFQNINSDNRSDVDKAMYVIRQLWVLSDGKNQMRLLLRKN